MRPTISICGAVALLAMASLPVSPPAHAAPASAVAQASHATPATDLSARRRAQRHVRSSRKAYRGYAQPRYYARPYDYRPDGVAPFFPFRYGYGLDPSW